MVNRTFVDLVTPKYLYRAKTPFGNIIEEIGVGNKVAWPKKLINKLWVWRFLGYLFKESFWIYIERKEINKYKQTNWKQCFWWPVSKL